MPHWRVFIIWPTLGLHSFLFNFLSVTFSVCICLLEFPPILCFTIWVTPSFHIIFLLWSHSCFKTELKHAFMKPSLILLVKCNPLRFELDPFLQRFHTIRSSVSVCVSRSVVSASLGPRGLFGPMRCLCPWTSPGKNTVLQGSSSITFIKYIWIFFLISKIFLGHLL